MKNKKLDSEAENSTREEIKNIVIDKKGCISSLIDDKELAKRGYEIIKQPLE